MDKGEYFKDIKSAELDAIILLKALAPLKSFSTVDLKTVYDQFDILYQQSEKVIDPNGQKSNIMGNHLAGNIEWSKKFIQAYANSKADYKKAMPHIGSAFGKLMGAVQFGFKSGNPDVSKYKKEILEDAVEISRILKTVNPTLKLINIPKRILEIYKHDTKNVHFFAAEFAQELSR